MALSDLELFDQNPSWRLLLAAYQARVVAGVEWIPRVLSVDGLANEELSAVHGKLIALGLLKFEISNRTDGVQYQLTTLGRQAMLPPESRQLIPDWLQTEDAETAAA